MILLRAELAEDLHEPSKLRDSLQTALRLEHSTIPPYLVAAYSLGPSNRAIQRILVDVAKEEMLHMTLVCNLINALGGDPDLKSPQFIPHYPDHLPGSVQVSLSVGLERFSLELLEQVFLLIEQPEKPGDFPVVLGLAPAESITIGQFYGRVKEVIRNGGESLFTTDSDRIKRQMVRTISDVESIAVTNVASAIAAIDLIIDQGEGTGKSPLEAATGEPAHYYRFQGILKGGTLKTDSTVPEGFAFKTDPANKIVFDPAGVFPVKADLKVADLPAGSAVRALAVEFNKNYTQMLFELHAAFETSGGEQQAHVSTAQNLMSGELRKLGHQLTTLEITPGSGVHAAPTFEFTDPAGP
jgi:rubrerythrin